MFVSVKSQVAYTLKIKIQLIIIRDYKKCNESYNCVYSGA